MKLRRSLISIALAAAALAACTADDPPSTRGKPTGASPTPDCGTIDVATDEYGTEIHPTKAPLGSKVTLSGTTVRGEDGRWAPSDRLEAWWNTKAPSGEAGGALKPGPIVQLVVVENMERCRFEASFRVPESLPGRRYRISVFVWEADPDGGYGLFLPQYFTVTEE